MSLTKLFSDKKTITVSGLYSGIGKTLLSEHIISMVNDIAAIKITIDHLDPLITDDKQSIMVDGKDTFRLKTKGAKRVVWIRTKEEEIESSVQQALTLIHDCTKVLIEGNSILNYMTPELAIFLCDEKLMTITNMKPTRLTAITKADIIINNIRSMTGSNDKTVEKECRKINRKASFISLNIKDKTRVLQSFKEFLSNRGFI